MKRYSFLVIALLFTAIFAVAAHAQGGAAQAPVAKVGLIDSAAFDDEKEGVTRYINAVKALRAEVAPKDQELNTIQSRLKTLSEDVQKLTSNPNVPVDEKAYVAKQFEGQRLQREFDYKKKELEAYVQRRQGELLAPIQADLGKAMQDFANQRGYTLLLDLDKMGQAGSILALDPKSEVTKEFITFFNARPATSASTSTPK